MKKYLKCAGWEFLLSNLLALADVVCVSYYPWLLSYVIDHFDFLQREDLVFVFSTFVLSIVLILTVSYLNKLVKARYEKKICRALRRDVFEGTARMSYTQFHGRKCEDYASFLMNDVEQLYAQFFENLIYLINSILMLLAYTLILALLNWQMCLVIMGSLVLILFVPQLVGRRFHRLNEALSAGKADYLSRCGEVLAAHDLMDNDNRERLCGLHHRQLDGMQEKQYALAKYRSFVQIFSGAALYVQLILCFVVGLLLAWFEIISVGLFASCLLYAEYVAQYSANIVDEFLEIRSSKTYRDRCREYLDVPQTVGAEAQDPFEVLELRGVSYEIEGKPILRDMSHCFLKGKKYLITGANGTGKSTLLKILAGVMPPSGGTVLFNGGSGYVHGAVGYVPQRRCVFEGTLADNISLFGEGDENRMKNLCTLANLNYPLNYRIKRNGENLSGGEVAKLCLLRELYRNREVLFIDEPMNDVDEQSQQDILNFLMELDKTIVIVAHGLGVREQFDQILTVADGILV